MTRRKIPDIDSPDFRNQVRLTWHDPERRHPRHLVARHPLAHSEHLRRLDGDVPTEVIAEAETMTFADARAMVVDLLHALSGCDPAKAIVLVDGRPET